MGALAVRCPHCYAGRGVHCRTPSGVTRPIHEARRKLWKSQSS